MMSENRTEGTEDHWRAYRQSMKEPQLQIWLMLALTAVAAMCCWIF